MGFRGRIVYLSQLIADSITGATINGGTITGALFRTAASGKRWEISSSPSNRIKAYSGAPGETNYGYLDVDVDATYGNQTWVTLTPPGQNTATVLGRTNWPVVQMVQDVGSPNSASNPFGEMLVEANQVYIKVPNSARTNWIQYFFTSSGLQWDPGTGLVPFLSGSDSGWQSLTLYGCQNLDTTNYAPAQYRVIANQVFLRGVISYTTSVAANTRFANGGTAIAATHTYTITGAILNGTPHRLDIHSNGDIVFADTAASSGWFASLDGVSYRND